MPKDPKEGGLCWKCRKPAADEDNFCRLCGSGLRSFPWYYQHWGIIVLTLLALGPFSVFLVWRSPVLGRTAKFIYTAFLALLTYAIAVQLYAAWTALKLVLSGAGLGL
ncbi:MAG: hypothetical protein PHF00_07090 [Elusimicrobia bacterium]|nr:hypothetical protein [Elusimicrobiota bacterium]